MFLLSTLFIVVHSNIKLQVLKIHKDNILSAKFSSFKQYVCEIKLVYYTTISVYATSSFLKWLNFLTISDKYIIHSIYLSSWPAFLPVSVHLSPSLQNLFLHSDFVLFCDTLNLARAICLTLSLKIYTGACWKISTEANVSLAVYNISLSPRVCQQPSVYG